MVHHGKDVKRNPALLCRRIYHTHTQHISIGISFIVVVVVLYINRSQGRAEWPRKIGFTSHSIVSRWLYLALLFLIVAHKIYMGETAAVVTRLRLQPPSQHRRALCCCFQSNGQRPLYNTRLPINVSSS